MSKAPSQTQDKFIVRLPEGMRERIKAAADDNNRSMNAEIVATLSDAYPEPKGFDLAVFLLDWSQLVAGITDREELRRLTDAANHELEGNAMAFRAEIDPDRGGLILRVVSASQD